MDRIARSESPNVLTALDSNQNQYGELTVKLMLKKLRNGSRVKQVVSIFCLGLLIASCGKEPQSASEPPSASNQGVNAAEVVQEFNDFVDGISIECNDSACPLNLVMVASLDVNEQHRVCTGVFLDSTRILTSSLCLPFYYSEKKECDDQIRILGVRKLDNGKHIEYPCTKVAKLSTEITDTTPPENRAPDYAVLEIPRASGVFAERRGARNISNGQQYTSWAIDFDRQSRLAKIVVADLSIVLQNYIQPLVTGNQYHNPGFVTESPLSRSYSGAPVYDERGVLVGMITDFMDQSDINRINVLEENRFENSFGFFTNINCLQLDPGVSSRASKKACDYQVFSNSTIRDARDLLIDISPFRADFISTARDAFGDFEEIFDWRVTSQVSADNKSIRWRIQPVCIKSLELHFLNNRKLCKKWNEDSKTCSRYHNRFEELLTLPTPRVVLGFDESFRVKPFFRTGGSIEMRLRFQPKSIFREGKSEITFAPVGQESIERNIGMCQSESLSDSE